MRVHSAEWFQSKLDEATRRIETTWTQSMRENAVIASATLPCIHPIDQREGSRQPSSPTETDESQAEHR